MNRPVLVACLASLLIAGGCSTREDDMRAELAQLTAGVKGKIPPLPTLTPSDPIAYRPDGLTDPFSPAKLANRATSKSGVLPDLARTREHLESFPLDAFRMLGSVTVSGIRYAVLQVNGATYQVAPGAFIGQNLGRIMRVTEISVSLSELTRDSGDWVQRDAEISIPATSQASRNSQK